LVIVRRATVLLISQNFYKSDNEDIPSHTLWRGHSDMQICFQIHRQLSDSSARNQTYVIDISPGKTVLDCLNQIKWELDGSLAFRKNCRNTICGSCGMHINGRAALACQQTIAMELERLPMHHLSSETSEENHLPTITVRPLPNLPVIKDLVVDMSRFWQNLERIDPYIKTQNRAIPAQEFLQSPTERAALDPMSNCIMCGACYSECNAQVVIPDFIGPHALAKLNRLFSDSRDTEDETRLAQANTPLQGVWGCTRCLNCNAVCPMGVAPLDQIHHLKQPLLTSTLKSRPVRHRRVMLELVARDGWIDERQFGVRVVGNNFKDIPGLLSLLPLGCRMLTKGKFPFKFEPSLGKQAVRSLLNSIKMLKSNHSSSKRVKP
jgi:succinate dehydrogenase / fumarate reductase iron-sulfur subunit